MIALPWIESNNHYPLSVWGPVRKLLVRVMTTYAYLRRISSENSGLNPSRYQDILMSS